MHNFVIKKIIFISIILLASGLLASIWWLNQESVPMTEEPSKILPVSAPITVLPVKKEPTKVTTKKIPETRPVNPVLSFQWQTGDRQTYSYRLHTDIRVNTTITQPNAHWQEVALHLDGVLNARVFAKEDGKIYLGFQLAPVSVTLHGEALPILEKLYGTFFMASLSPQGKFLNFYFPVYLKTLEEQVPLSELVNLAQTVLPEKMPALQVWNTKESHGSGDYKALYQWQDGIIRKQKTAYTKISDLTRENGQGLEIKAQVLNSKTEINVLEQYSWLESLSLHEQLLFTTEHGKLSEASYALTLKHSNLALDTGLDIWNMPDKPTQVRERLASMQHLSGDTHNAWETMRLEQLRQTFAGVKVGDLLTELTQAENTQDKFKYGRKLTKYLEAYPEAAQILAQQLKQKHYAADISAAVIASLVSAGHIQAQQALLALIVDEHTEADAQVMQATVGAGGIKNPEPLLLDGLWQQINSNAREYDTALLSLGRLGRTLGDINEIEIVQELSMQLSDYLQQPDISPRNQMLVLKSLANMGDPNAYPIVEPYLNTEKNSVRAAAHQVLGNLDDSESHTILLKSIAQDKSILVRQTALNSLLQRPDQNSSTTVTGVAQILSQETDTGLRTDMIQFLGRNKAVDPTVSIVLQQQLEQETSREMLKEVYKALYQPDPEIKGNQ